MKTLHLEPLVGVDSIRLGAPRGEALSILGPCSATFRKSPSSVHPTDAWLNNGFQVFYSGAEPIIEYIELSRGSGFEVVLFGHPVFSTEASTLLAVIENHARLDTTDPELGYSYIFPSLELSIWRPTVEPPDGQFFATVGIGIHGYYSQ
jgi:hypothetical protein